MKKKFTAILLGMLLLINSFSVAALASSFESIGNCDAHKHLSNYPCWFKLNK